MPDVVLEPFTEAHLPVVRPWFLDVETRHRLGGPAWPERALRLTQTRHADAYRGLPLLATHLWVAVDDTSEPVAVIAADIYPKWGRYDGLTLTDVEAGPSMGLAYVVDPGRRRRGFGRAALDAIVGHPDHTDIRVFAAGIDADNEASRRCAASAGFRPDVDEPDREGTVYYLLRMR